MKKKWMFALLTIVLGLILGACQGAKEDENKGGDEKKELKFGINAWAENIAVSNMWKILLEEKGYEVELKELEKAAVWTGVAQKDIDIAPEAWLPFTDAPFWDQYKDNVVKGDAWYKGTGLGIAVPKYMENVNSLEDLNKWKEELNGKIYGIEPGTSLMNLSEKMLEEYQLEYELVPSSEAAMLSQLKESMNNEKPIAITMWNPHWAFSAFDIKYLEDPKEVYGKPDDIFYLTRRGFEEDFPKVKEWFDNWDMNDDQLGSLMKLIEDAGDPVGGAKQWIEENRDLVDSWMTE
ncbi:glycine betaine ABC transporter substrate-binding protein [Bacillus alveayuensis]|jgi:glycine betaine/proline transport system substrate-binding protein|uniref:glycine betaine ABC transporter substrate-binding protein n=1 Tax=Aeribacillus alveayuensis TaxID=279215 RepID=UPI0005D132BF|nr:glycine betaine ABC transporter substrate-binding protein [Bacillus alveayuensis]